MTKYLNIIIVVLFFSSLILLGASLSNIALGSSNSQNLYDYQLCKERDFKKSETIYSKVECSNCNCVNSGEKLFTALGTDSDCENKTSESARNDCYNSNSFAKYKCDNKGMNTQKCYSEYPGCKNTPYNYNLGSSGTFVNLKNFIIGGIRTYFNGFDKNYTHRIFSDFRNYEWPSITLGKNSRDIKIGGDLLTDNDIKIFGSNSGVYFSNNTKFGAKHYIYNDGQTKKDGFGIINKNSSSGLESSKYLNGENDLLFKANNQNLAIFPDDADTEDARRYDNAPDIQTSLEVNGPVNIDNEMYFQGHKLLWSQPIRGHIILYYK